MSSSDYIDTHAIVELSLRDRPAIVTGTSRGVSHEIAVQFAETGGDVAICSYSLDNVRPIAEELTTAHNGRAIPVECDVAGRDEAQSLVDTALDGFGEVKVLVNNADGSDESANVAHHYDEEAFERMVDLDLKSQPLLSREVLPAMVAVGGGSMIHMGSVNGLFGIGLSGYSEAKSGLLAMSRDIATHYGQHGVRSSVVSAGTIETASRRGEMENTEGRTGDSNAREGWPDQYPLGHFETPREVADTLLFFASELSSFITGESVVLDGGLTTSLSTSFISEVYDTDEISSRR